MATNPAGGSPYGDLSGTRQFIIKDSVKNQDATALTQAVANAATGDYTVGDLVDLLGLSQSGGLLLQQLRLGSSKSK